MMMGGQVELTLQRLEGVSLLMLVWAPPGRMMVSLNGDTDKRPDTEEVYSHVNLVRFLGKGCIYRICRM